MNKIYRTCALLLLLAGLTAGCGGEDGRVTLEQPVQAAVPQAAEQPVEEPVQTAQQDSESREYGTVQLLQEARTYQAVGSFVDDETVTVSTRVGGTIQSVRVNKGDFLRRGALIAELDTADFRLALDAAKAQVAIAQANLDNASNEYQRKKQLFDDGAIPEGQFDTVASMLALARAQHEAAQVAVRQAEKALADSRTTSPVNGVVSKRMMSAGEFIGTGDPIVVISMMDPIKLIFSLPERLAREVTKGSPVRATLTALPGRTYEGTVTLVGPTVDPVTRTIPVEATFKNPDLELRSGFFADATIGLGSGRATFLVPAAAIVDEGNGPVVQVVKAEGIRNVSITEVQRLSDGVRVFADLSDGDRVVLHR